MITDLLLEMTVKNYSTKQMISIFENLFDKHFLVNSDKNPIGFQQYLFNEFWLIYQTKINEFKVHGDGFCENMERNVSLLNIDFIWCKHLQEMSLLREAVSWRGYGQRNPLYEYKREALQAFKEQSRVVKRLIINEFLSSSVL